MDDVIKLLTETITADEHGNQTATTTERTVFCTVLTVSRSEFYSAAQTDLHPEYVFRLSHYRDYQGEKLLKYTDWSGVEKTYSVVRVYKAQDGDALEIIAEERIGSNA